MWRPLQAALAVVECTLFPPLGHTSEPSFIDPERLREVPGRTAPSAEAAFSLVSARSQAAADGDLARWLALHLRPGEVPTPLAAGARDR